MGEASREDYVRDCCRRVMQMVGELHKLGYEGLRIVPEIAAKGKGPDPEYVAWYLEMLKWCLEEDEFPVAYDDWWEEPDPVWLPTTRGMSGDLRRPPGGEGHDAN